MAITNHDGRHSVAIDIAAAARTEGVLESRLASVVRQRALDAIEESHLAEVVDEIVGLSGIEEALGWVYHLAHATGTDYIADARRLRSLAVVEQIPWRLY